MIFDLFDYIIGVLKMVVYKLFYREKMKYRLFGKYSKQFQLRIFNKGQIEIGKNVVFRAGVKIRINGNGIVKIGNDCGLNNYSLLNAMDCIEIKDHVIIGQGVQIYDHDHKREENRLMRYSGFFTASVIIEENVWIGSGCIILKGSHIGKNAVIAAGSLVKGDVPANTIFYNRREKIFDTGGSDCAADNTQTYKYIPI